MDLIHHTISMMWKICLLLLELQIIIRATDGTAFERNPKQNGSHGRYRREAANHQPTAVPETIVTPNVVSAVVQTSESQTVFFPSSDQSVASVFSYETTAPVSTQTPASESNQMSSVEELTAFTFLDCFQEDIQPISYAISISPQLNDWTFDAETNITIKVLRQCATLRLLKNKWMINNITLMSIESQVILETNQLFENSINLTVQFTKPIPLGTYKLIFKCSCIIPVVPQGRIGESDEYLTGLIITTTRASHKFDFTTIQTRFPCWNSPGVKVDYNITIQYDSKTLKGISNMHETGRNNLGKNELMTKFDGESHFPMQGLSFLLSNDKRFKCRPNHRSYLYTVCSNSHHSYSTDVMMRKMESLTNVMPYVPSSSQRINVVILKKKNLSVDNLQILRCGLVITIHSGIIFNTILTSYGIASQWFNCLVTPMKSSHKWLSTGLATYYGDKIIPDKIYGYVKEDITIMEHMEAMMYNSDPIITSILPHVKDANAIHDRAVKMILNYKATSIIRMISYAISETKLHIAVENYLKKNFHLTTTSADLIDELKTVTDASMTLNIEPIIESWLNMQSLPSVTVVRNYTTGYVTVTQNPLTIDNPLRAELYNRIAIKQFESSPKQANERFWIPINYVTYSDKNILNTFDNKTVTHWLRPSENSIVIPAEIKSYEWIIVNRRQFGYYRVNYDAENWRLIIETLNSAFFRTIDPFNRAQLIDDAFSFLEAGQLDYETVFNLIEYLKEETAYLPWTIAERHISRMFSTLLESPEHNFKEYMMNISKKIADDAFTTFGVHYFHVLYPQLVTSFCRWGLASCSSGLEERYTDWLNGLDPNLEAMPTNYPIRDAAQLSNLILCYGGQTIADNQTWDILQGQWKTNPLVMNIIACRPDKSMVKTFFADVSQSPAISSRAFFHIINLFVLNNCRSDAFPILYDALKENLENIYKMSNYSTGPDSDLMLESIDAIVSIENPTKPPFHALRAFFKANEDRLESYFNRQDIREYLLRTEINNVDLSLPVFNRFRKN